MTNPYESPKSGSEPNQGPPVTGRDIGAFLLGALLCASITFIGAAIAGAIASVGGRGPYAGVTGLVVFLNSPAVIGPICGGIIWAITRKRRRPFAIGAVALGVAAFLFVGGCLTLMSSF